jgi:UTP:GlnB (protein PII) uridylyltransferase
VLDAARAELRADTLRGAGGRAALERYSDRVDALLRQIFADAGEPPSSVLVLALGGYGRRHLCFYSDIDLLILFSGSIYPAEERFLRGLLHPLWDLGVVVGHQVRELDDFRTLETDNPEFLLALLDARPVAGARDLFDRFAEVFHAAATHAFILTSLLQLIDERYAKFNGTLYQLEPDVKQAPGALRDLSATRIIALLTDPLLLRRGPADPARFDDAEDFLLRVRSTLHLEGARNQNVLSHEMQERTAEVLGYPGAEPRIRVERLMSDYFRHARIVHRSLHWARKTAPVPVGANLGLSRDGVPVSRSHTSRSQPALVDRDVSSRHRTRPRRCRGGAVVHSAARRSISCRRLFPATGGPCRGVAPAEAAEGPLRALIGDARLRSARSRVSRSSRRSRGGWCATSTTSTRSTSTRC